MNANIANSSAAEAIELGKNARRLARSSLGRALRKAIDHKEFVLYYQPQLDYADKLTGAEALIRWRRGGRGMVFPADFIGFAEETGLIVEIGAWALLTACRQLSSWQRKACTRNLTLAVNVSARQLSEPDFVPLAMAIIEASGIDPHMLKLELTESRLLADIAGSALKMSVLRALGVSFSLDDFGTGHCSLAYLRELPLDQLKIDQSFVRDIVTSATNAAIVRSTVDLARSLGLAVIAEGVETPEQRESLASCGCYDYQGFLYHRALPADEFYRFARCRPRFGLRQRPWQWRRHALSARRSWCDALRAISCQGCRGGEGSSHGPIASRPCAMK